MIKKLIFIGLTFFILGCSSGGDECPSETIELYYTPPDGILALEIIERGDLNQRAVISKEECQELLDKYRAKLEAG